MNKHNNNTYVDPRLTGRVQNSEPSIVKLMESTGLGRDEILNKLGLVQPPITPSNEPFRSSRASIKQIKRITTIVDDSLIQAFANWSNYKPNWGGFIFNGVKI